MRGGAPREVPRARGGRRPTLEEVAAAAGVGRGTVSRVINGSSHVSEATRLAVLRAIEELGYAPNHAARALVTQRTDSLALVVSESEERLFAEPFFARIVRAISAEVHDAGKQLLLAMARSPGDRERLEHYVAMRHVDGALLLSLHGDDPLPRQLESRGVPTVIGGRPLGWEPASYVDVDNAEGARLAVAHLLERGRSRIAVLAGPQDMSAGRARLEGCRDTLAAAGRPLDEGLVGYGDFSEPSGAAAMEQVLARVPDVDAVFAASDPMALGALRVLKHRGRRVPQDVSVVGYDDSPSSEHADPPLTTVHQPVEEMGREMARLLVARVYGEPPWSAAVVLPPRLVVRTST